VTCGASVFVRVPAVSGGGRASAESQSMCRVAWSAWRGSSVALVRNVAYQPRFAPQSGSGPQALFRDTGELFLAAMRGNRCAAQEAVSDHNIAAVAIPALSPDRRTGAHP